MTNKEYCAQYYIKNAETIIARAKKYVEEHREHVKEYQRKYQLEHRQKIYEDRNSAQHKYRVLQPRKYLFNQAKKRSQKKGIEFTIALSDLPEIPKICPLLGIPIDQTTKTLDNHASIDRQDNSKGYIPGNVWFISHRANRLKNNAAGLELMILGLNLIDKGY